MHSLEWHPEYNNEHFICYYKCTRNYLLVCLYHKTQNFNKVGTLP